MGWQGRMRGIKAERFWRRMPDELTAGASLLRARCWRDNRVAYVLLERGGRWYSARVRRATGELVGEDALRPVRSPLDDLRSRVPAEWRGSR